MKILKMLLALIGSGLLSAQGASIFVTEDTSSVGGKISGVANSSKLLNVNRTSNAYLYFEMGEFDSSRPLRSARLRFYFASALLRGSGIGVHVVEGGWTEGSSKMVVAPVHKLTPSAVISRDDIAAKYFVSVDVTEVVRGWLKDPNTNHGFALVPVTTAGGVVTSAALASKEGIGNGIPAMLDMEFGETEEEFAARFLPRIVTPVRAEGTLLSVEAKTTLGTLSYQWYKDGVAILGATTKTYDAGGQAGAYYARVSNGIVEGEVQSEPFVVISPPVITSQPFGGDLLSDGTLMLSVVAEGSELSYQWMVDGVQISGATQSTYMPKQAGNYSVVIRNSAGEIASMVALVTAKQPVYRLIGVKTDTDEVVEIDTATGGWKVLFKLSVDVDSYTGFDYNPADGFLYLSKYSKAGSCDFYQIDLGGKSCTKVKTLTYAGGDGSFESLGFTKEGNIYAYDESAAFALGKLFSVEWSTMATKALGTSGTPSIIGGDFDDVRNVFWACDEWNGKVYQLDPKTGSVVWTSTETWPTGHTGSLLDMDVAPNGDVLMIGQLTSSPGTLSLLRVDSESKNWVKLCNVVTTEDMRIASVPVSGEGMVLVKGGTLPSGSELAGQVVGDFRIGKYEVTWGEWKVVRDWAVTKGYDLSGVGGGSGEDHPVRDVNWYQVVKWCNARSEKEGKTPVYKASGVVYRTGDSVPTVDASANGYRLPLEKEWEWAARGGVSSKGYEYSGSNDLNEVGWYRENSGGAAVVIGSGRGTLPVGKKKANELGLYDMSGNVWELCFDEIWGANRVVRGGFWNFAASRCTVVYRDDYPPTLSGTVAGFRVASSSVP
jgi:sulfatase modifying factor 1